MISKSSVVLCCLSFALLVLLVRCQDSDITKFMKHLEVIPDVTTEGPKDFLKVSEKKFEQIDCSKIAQLQIVYENGVVAEKGVELTPTQVKKQPIVEWKSEADTFYTLIMTDPDAPSRSDPKMREWHHWLVGNIPGNDISKGEVLSQYVGSGPPKGTGLHRYITFVFKQPMKLEFDEPRLSNKSANGRANFSTKNFVKKYSLGAPIAGNFYQAEWDEYVPELHKQLGASN